MILFRDTELEEGFTLIEEQRHACIEFNVPYMTGIYDTTEV